MSQVGYEYLKPEKPDSDYIVTAVQASTISPTLLNVRWDEEPHKLCVFFDAALDTAEKTELDGIVALAGGD